MSFKEKQTIASILTGIAVLAAYCIYAFGKAQSGLVNPHELKFWAATMLIFIGIGIGAIIVIQIVFSILLSISIAIKEKIQNEQINDKEIEIAVKNSIGTDMVEDEMDKLIELKSTRVGYSLSGFGMIAGLVSLVLNYSPAVMLNIIFISFNVGSLIEGFAKLFYYRRGIKNA